MVKGKKVSKIGMMLSVTIALLYNLGYLIFERKIPTVDEQKSILMLSGFIVIFFSPIYASIILDKIIAIFKPKGE